MSTTQTPQQRLLDLIASRDGRPYALTAQELRSARVLERRGLICINSNQGLYLATKAVA